MVGRVDGHTESQPWLRWLTLATVLGLAQWFFGNLYEAVVISPNWVIDSPAQLARLHAFFVKTSPTSYFVPLSQAVAVLTWLLLVLNKDHKAARDYRRAGLFALLASALNVFIVATIVLKLFASDFGRHEDELHTLCVRWNALNAVRMLLVATTAVFLFRAFRILDRPQGAG